MRRLAATCSMAIAAALAAAPALRAQSLLPLPSYGVITARRPFGDLSKLGPKKGAPTPEEAAAAQAEAQQAKDRQQLARQIDLVAVNITLRGTVSVGFIDKGAKPPRSLYLGIGESESGFKVEAADFAEETATISKDGVSVTLKLGSGLVAATETPADGASEAASESASEKDGDGARPAALRTARPAAAIRRPAGPGLGYRSNVLDRRRAENAARAEEARQRMEETAEIARKAAGEAADEAAARREHDMNFRMLLEGKEPASEIKLTEEEEAELVRRGLLPPAQDNEEK